jgi:hypothetical protein
LTERLPWEIERELNRPYETKPSPPKEVMGGPVSTQANKSDYPLVNTSEEVLKNEEDLEKERLKLIMEQELKTVFFFF